MLIITSMATMRNFLDETQQNYVRSKKSVCKLENGAKIK